MNSEGRKTIFVCIVNKDTGEIYSNCAKCCVVSMDNEINVIDYPCPKDHTVIEITQEEFQQMHETITKNGDQIHAHRIELSKSKRQVKNRDKEEYTVNEHGISYQNLRPVKATKENR